MIAAERGQLLVYSREFENAELLCGISPVDWKVWLDSGDSVCLTIMQLDLKS